MNNDYYNYANFKYEIDAMLQRQVDTNMDYTRAHLISVNPVLFVIKTLPFSSMKEIKNTLYSAMINPFTVIGGTFNDYSSKKTSTEYCKLINKKSRTFPNYTNAHYFKVGDMPLYIAMERKNRVKLFRNYNVPIRANVVKVEYPKPSELKIHKVRWRKELYFVSCSNKDFYREQYQSIKYHSHELKTLSLYGSKGDSYGYKSKKFRIIDMYGHINDSLVPMLFPKYVLPVLIKYGVEYGEPITKPFLISYDEKLLEYFSNFTCQLS